MFNFFKRNKGHKLDWQQLFVEPTDHNDFGPCSCCGNMSRTVWGFVHLSDETIAAYFVQWTLNNPEHGANFDLIIGQWGDESGPHQRQAAALEYRVHNGQPSFIVVDASTRDVADYEMASVALNRNQVIGKPIAEIVFSVVDAIFMKNDRIKELHMWV